MSLLLYGNKALTANSAGISITSSSGTITHLTDKSKLLNRNLADAYHFSCSASATITLTIAGVNASARSAGLLGCKSLSNLKWGTTSLPESADESIEKKRFVNLQTEKDYIYIKNSAVSLSDLKFEFTVISGAEYYIGAAWISDALDLDVKIPVDYKVYDTSIIDVSNGGQVYASEGQTYESVKFTTTKNSKSTARDADISVRALNQQVGSRRPLIFIPEYKNDIHVYGYQKPLATLKQIEAKDSNNDWWWQCVFNITEEL